MHVALAVVVIAAQMGSIVDFTPLETSLASR